MSSDNAVSGRNILITGGAGFIGSHLVDRLASDNQVVVLDSFRHGPPAETPGSVAVVDGDVLDPDSVAKACAGMDDVIHLAALAGVETTRERPVETLNVNLLGTVNALDGAAAAGVRRFVFFSTSEVYGAHAAHAAEDQPAVVGTPTEARWGYAAAKLAGEFYTMRYHSAGALQAMVIRPFNVYGPRQRGGGAVFRMCSAALNEGAVTVLGSGTAVRAWCHVADLVDGIVRSLASPAAAGEVFNIGNPHTAVTSAELAARVAALVPGTEIRHAHLQGPDVEIRIPDIAKAERLLGYRPRVGLDEGLRDALEWYRRELAS